ncbi:aminotransferase class I/II-fold pyridoxal phosphate-dependent enzyme, partial [Campylobacter jejuni]|uniref:aminotransferase class I/II-fold pyridoxal phosphate-dependent enzyme n=1 Tax=Campylobacter jejuni TaxID=197 RepID=UPI001EDA77CE
LRTLTPLKHENKFVYKQDHKLLNLVGNDYLYLASSKELKAEFLNTLKEQDLFFSSSSSRSLSGNFEIYEKLESFLKTKFKDKEILHFNSGYHLNISCIAALSSVSKTLFLTDKFIHASMIDGLRLGRADFFRFHHKDMNHLESLIQKHYENYENIIVLSEALFSMDGDFSDFKTLCELKRRYDKIKLYIDEAHSVGCFDEEGLGLEILKDILEKNASEICAFILEPLVQCAGNMHMYEARFIDEAIKLCHKFGVQVIFDEIAVGFGRTGTLFALHQCKQSPDFI